MKIELLKNPEMIRKRFIDRFLEDRDRFQITHQEFIGQLKEFDQWFDQSYMWDRLPHDVPVVTISQALELLKSRKGDVLFMSECEGFHATCHLPINGENVEGFVAKADPKELADRIAYEWYEGWKLLQENRYLPETLPEDLYVFDETYDWMIVFTHETDWDSDDTEEGLETRFCRAYGLNL